jgi:hypothetical protein
MAFTGQACKNRRLVEATGKTKMPRTARETVNALRKAVIYGSIEQMPIPGNHAIHHQCPSHARR